MKGKSFQLLLLLSLAFCDQLTAQQVEAYINGPAYVTEGPIIRYEITFSQPRPEEQNSPISFSVSGGSIIQSSTSSQYGNPYLDVIWNSPYDEGTIEVTGWAYGLKTIYMGVPLQPGQIACNYPYYNANNDRVSVTSTPASDGTAPGFYSYTWQSSVDGINWSDIGGGELYPNSITINTRTLIRRQVDCNGEIKYSNVLIISYQPSNFENRNFINTNILWYAGKKTLLAVDQAPIGQKQQSVVYYDGMSRPEQSIVRGASPDQKDLVTPFEYDYLGREGNKYLAYPAATGDGLFKVSAKIAQGLYMGDPVTGKYKDESEFYATTLFESSPLNRPTKALAPGTSWNGNGVGIGTEYDLNTSADAVRIWRIDAFDPNAIPVSNPTDIYPAYTLSKKTTIDERGKKIIEYSDKEGQVILKKQQLAETGSDLTQDHGGWLCTYYVYDDIGRLRFMITPKAVEQMHLAGSWIVSQQAADGLCYRYTYDGKGRLIEKKLPDADVVYMIYDDRGRLVLSQDGNQRTGINNPNQYKEWTFYLYDVQNRQVASGTMFENAGYTRINLQNRVTGYHPGEKTFSISTDVAENVTAYDPVPLFIGVGEVILHEQIKINTVNYYDEATAASFTSADLGYAGNFENIDPTAASNRNRGLQTGTKARILDQNGNAFSYSKTIYDDKGRVLQTTGKNYLGYDVRLTNQYDFSGKVRSSNYSEEKSLTGGGFDRYKIISKFEMDHVGRLVKIKKDITRNYKLNSSTQEMVTATGEKTVVENKYDELGQLLSKTLAPGYNNANGNPYLEKLTYDYNIRGWITGINKDYVNNSSSDGGFFGMELGYDKLGVQVFANAILNGNVAGIAWKTAGDNTPRKYDYTYDNANRLTSANFNQRNTFSSGWTKDKHDFSVPMVTYNANGNIIRMEQNGVNFTGIVSMDRLQYGYDANSNKLQWVAEDANTDYKLYDFTDKNAGIGNVDYDYDANGNQTEDKNKGITSIKYNYLSLPELITLNNNRGAIRYIYDAAGNKLQKIVTDNTAGGVVTTTTFSGPVVYTGNEFYITFEEGRVRYAKKIVPDQQPVFAFDYFVKDHLGNVRMVLTEDTQTDQYPVATMEAATATDEDKYYKINNRSDRPPALQGQTAYDQRYGQKMSRLTALADGQKIGPSIILKVMTGDLVHAKTDYYYADNGSQVNTSSLLNDLANNLINHLLTGQAGLTAKAQASAIGANAVADDVVESLITTQDNNYDANRPKAFLSYIVFDEQFKAVSKGTIQVQNSGPLQPPLPKSDIEINQNGWIYVFVNNESQQPVYFDNFQVTHVRGNILEETHYYPFGLAMKAISPRALSITPVNRDKYNGKQLQSEEFSDGTGLEAYDYGDRMYDPQTGRWYRQDPLAEEFPNVSPYAYATNNPTLFIDKDGKFVNLIMQYGINVGINVAVQMLTAYMFDPKVKSWGDAWDKVSMWSAIWEGATDMIGSRNLRMAANGVTGIFGYIDQVGMSNITATGLISSGLMGILEPIVGDAVGKYGAAAVRKGLQKLGIDGSTINRMLGIRETPTFVNNVADDVGEQSARRVSKRLQYLGATPGKSSRTGRDVIARMTSEGKFRTRAGLQEFMASDGRWYPLQEADMAHRIDAVTWWNQMGRQFGAKSAEVRQWMLDPNNYYLEHFSINRSAGARLNQTYMDPL